MRGDILTEATNHAEIENLFSLKWANRFPTQSKYKGEKQISYLKL